MLVGEQKLVPEATGNSPDEKMDTASTNGVELCRVSRGVQNYWTMTNKGHEQAEDLPQIGIP